MNDWENPVHAAWWYVSPRRLVRTVLLIALGVCALTVGVTNWLQSEWDKAPTVYPDGRVVHPDGRVEYRRDRPDRPQAR